MGSSTTPTRPIRAAWTASGACTSGSTGRPRAVTRRAPGYATMTCMTGAEAAPEYRTGRLPVRARRELAATAKAPLAARNVFWHDRLPRRTERASVGSTDGQANGTSGDDAAEISANGRFVAFTSSATNLVPHDTNGADDAFVSCGGRARPAG